jgi:hypothetical protein
MNPSRCCCPDDLLIDGAEALKRMKKNFREIGS